MKKFDSLYTTFASETRNVTLMVTTYGFNPFGNMNVSYSIWLVVLSLGNIPPWSSNKPEFSIMSTIISGPNSPGYDIDVYLQPLIYELKEMWEVGVETYDAFKNETFTLRAALLSTTSDFPALSMLSGWSTKGRLACPCCNYDTDSRYLKHSRKFCYMVHRRHLRENHPWRRNKSSFNGEEEKRPSPKNLSGFDLLES